MPEIGMLGTGCDDEIIVGNATAFRDHLFARRIDPQNFRQDNLGVALPTENAAYWRCNISRRQTRGERPPNPAPTMTTRGGREVA